MKKKIALIFGITGQDGSYLAEYLLKKNYIVHGVKRRSSDVNTQRINHIYDSVNFKSKNLILHYGDLADNFSIFNVVKKSNPDEIYNLGAQSHVKVSFDIPEYTSDVTGLGCLRILEAIRLLGKKIKFYQASSSEMYGNAVSNKSINELTKFNPRSMYGVSKVFAYYTTIHYREAYKIYASNGVLFNHESPRRGANFVTKKIVEGLIRIKNGNQQFLTLGNLYAERDWGHAKDYVESMWKILQYKKPDDWVISTNKKTSVKQFVNLTAKKLGFKIKWIGKRLKEKAIDLDTQKIIVKVSAKYFRPSEVNYLKGDFRKAKSKLKWQPKYSINQLIDDMIQNSDN